MDTRYFSHYFASKDPRPLKTNRLQRPNAPKNSLSYFNSAEVELRPGLFESGNPRLLGLAFGGEVGAEFVQVDFAYAEQELYGVSEIEVADGHGEVDGVEVLLAGEAAGEVGVGVGGGVESAAAGA